MGINTEKPEEALTVNGHIQLTGQLLQLSDMRLKRNITKVRPLWWGGGEEGKGKGEEGEGEGERGEGGGEMRGRGGGGGDKGKRWRGKSR